MKYKVSLLPESRKKQIKARESIKKIKSVSFAVFCVLFAFYIIVVAVNIFAQNKLKDIRELDAECQVEIDKLASYKDINTQLQQRISLFDKIEVKEPKLYQFLLDWSGVSHPGVSVESIECTDWKITRLCTIKGTCENRAQYLAYEEALKKIEGVTSVSCVNYTTNVGADNEAGFTISISVDGGAPVPTTAPATTAPATTAAAS